MPKIHTQYLTHLLQIFILKHYFHKPHTQQQCGFNLALCRKSQYLTSKQDTLHK